MAENTVYFPTYIFFFCQEKNDINTVKGVHGDNDLSNQAWSFRNIVN